MMARAIQIAASAHRGQRDKGDAPNIARPLRVMPRLTSERKHITAVLHDVLEDASWTQARTRDVHVRLQKYRRAHAVLTARPGSVTDCDRNEPPEKGAPST
jgi:hypothetical protein